MLSSYPVSVSERSDEEEERVFGQSVSAERGICQQLEEEEEEVILEEDFSCSRGDASEGAATRGTKIKTHSSQVSHTVQERGTLSFNFNNLNNMFSLCWNVMMSVFNPSHLEQVTECELIHAPAVCLFPV